jgi:hypothetical protein
MEINILTVIAMLAAFGVPVALGTKYLQLKEAFAEVVDLLTIVQDATFDDTITEEEFAKIVAAVQPLIARLNMRR